MSLKASSSHNNGFVIKAEIGVPRNPAVKNDSIIESDVRT